MRLPRSQTDPAEVGLARLVLADLLVTNTVRLNRGHPS